MTGGKPFLVVPPTLRRLVVPRPVFDRTQRLLAGPGEAGLEAVVLWIGSVVSAVEAQVEQVHFPRQVAYATSLGLAVEIPVEEWTELALQLPLGRFVLGKLHTHPDEAYHSEQDAANPYLCHEGAFAITVPSFARDAFNRFSGWSVHVLRGQRWIELDPVEIESSIVVEDPAA